MATTYPSRTAGPTHGRRLTRQLLAVLVTYAVAGPVAGIAWWALWRRGDHTFRVGSPESAELLARVFDGGGWFFVVACVFGVVSGVVLADRCDADPLLTTMLVLVCSAGAGWLMARTGHALGPEPLRQALRAASSGDTVTLPLSVGGTAFWFVWPITALLGLTGRLLWPADEREGDGRRAVGARSWHSGEGRE